MTEDHFTEIATDDTERTTRATCECGWKGRVHRGEGQGSAAANEADWHVTNEYDDEDAGEVGPEIINRV